MSSDLEEVLNALKDAHGVLRHGRSYTECGERLFNLVDNSIKDTIETVNIVIGIINAEAVAAAEEAKRRE